MIAVRDLGIFFVALESSGADALGAPYFAVFIFSSNHQVAFGVDLGIEGVAGAVQSFVFKIRMVSWRVRQDRELFADCLGFGVVASFPLALPDLALGVRLDIQLCDDSGSQALPGRFLIAFVAVLEVLNEARGVAVEIALVGTVQRPCFATFYRNPVQLAVHLPPTLTLQAGIFQGLGKFV